MNDAIRRNILPDCFFMIIKRMDTVIMGKGYKAGYGADEGFCIVVD